MGETWNVFPSCDSNSYHHVCSIVCDYCNNFLSYVPFISNSHKFSGNIFSSMVDTQNESFQNKRYHLPKLTKKVTCNCKAEGIEVSVYRHPPASVFDSRVKFSLFDFFFIISFLSAENILGKHSII